MRRIESLHGIIRPDRDEAPPDAIFAIVPEDREFNLESKMKMKVPEVKLAIQTFVRLGVLSDGLQEKIRDEIKVMGEFDVSNLHQDTRNELEGKKL